MVSWWPRSPASNVPGTRRDQQRRSGDHPRQARGSTGVRALQNPGRVGRLRPSIGTCSAFIGTDLNLPACGMTSANIPRYESLDVNRVFEALDAATLRERMPYCFISSTSLKDPQGGHAPEGRPRPSRNRYLREV